MGSPYRGGAPLSVGVVLPVHNEERLLPYALRSLERAMRPVVQMGLGCHLVVVLDACTDRSAARVRRWASDARHDATALGTVTGMVDVVSLAARNVGLARRTGCDLLLHRWSHVPADRIWLATTDADSDVPAEWLAAQVHAWRAGVQLWVGRVAVRSWDGRAAGTAEAWHRRDADEHLPVHGANLGVDGATYLRAGGFATLATGEDRDLVNRALAQGASARSDPSVRVVTSARRHARAPSGFAQALSRVEASVPVGAAAS